MCVGDLSLYLLTHVKHNQVKLITILTITMTVGVPMVQEHCMSKYNAGIEELLYHCYMGKYMCVRKYVRTCVYVYVCIQIRDGH